MAPVFTSPTCAQTIAGPSTSSRAASRASGGIRPWSSAETATSASLPKPRRRSARLTVTWRFPPAKTCTSRCADEALALDIPADALEDGVTRRSETGDVRHLTPGDERVRRLTRKAEELQEPLARHLLRNGGRRPADDEPGVLIPGTRQPVGRQSRGKRAADDEAEVATTWHRDHAAVSGCRQLFHHHERVDPLARQRRRRAPGAVPRPTQEARPAARRETRESRPRSRRCAEGAPARPSRRVYVRQARPRR